MLETSPGLSGSSWHERGKPAVANMVCPAGAFFEAQGSSYEVQKGCVAVRLAAGTLNLALFSFLLPNTTHLY